MSIQAKALLHLLAMQPLSVEEMTTVVRSMLRNAFVEMGMDEVHVWRIGSVVTIETSGQMFHLSVEEVQ